MWVRCRYFLPGLLAVLSGISAVADEPWPNEVEFNRDIRPILSDACFHCHGPDKAQRKADLRLDTEEGALADLGGYAALVPGKLGASVLYQRITSSDPDERMPPADSGRKVTPRQVELLKRWIEQGAKWQKHWSLIPPERSELPIVKNAAWPRNPVDRFILSRLERENLPPSAEADKVTLLRRVTLDLTGLPPTPAEVDALLNDPSPDAYERAVDRLLASPRYGERMSTRWLDGARYADTSGYQNDGERHMWRWRDWVIDAYNSNLPFDRFTIEQLAGDLLPGATLDQKIATGFNRNHRGNAEGGIIPEEYAVEYVVDRVETTSTVWLGLTLGCTRCHDHKYDPFSQKEFYGLFALFNNVPEKGRAVKYGNSPPYVKSPTDDQERELAALDARLAAATSRMNQLAPRLGEEQVAWEKFLTSSPGELPNDWWPEENLLVHYRLDGNMANQAVAAKAAKGATAAEGTFADGEPAFATGRFDEAADFDGDRYIDAGNVADFGFYDKFSISAWIYLRGPAGGTIVSRMTDSARSDGYGLCLENGKVQLNLSKRWLDDALRVESEAAVAPDRWHHVLATYDGSRVAKGIQIFIDGRPQKIKVLLDELNQSFQNKEPLRIGAGGGIESRFHGLIDEVRIYRGALTPAEASVLATAEPIGQVIKVPTGERTTAQRDKLQAYFITHRASEELRTAHDELKKLARDREELIESFPTTMIMEEMPQPRDTFVLIRGEYDKHGEKVSSGVPASLTPFPAAAPRNRLGFAQWLVEPAHPLTSRVAVNRFWQMYFGAGLVKTVDDFGSQGEWPTHPELLDWLATEFIASGWNVKALQKLIVTSATYRQSSKLTQALLAKDPENRLLARGPRFRLSAEMIRDQALSASGLLVERVGGPSVMPYQPEGLWKDLAGADYTPDVGASLYRRSMYTFWKRTIAPPSMMTFDAAARETCMVRETRTNTPLQALTLMNDVTFVEASRQLAERVMHQAAPTAEARLTLTFRLATGRSPKPAELAILVGNYQRQLARFTAQPAAARELLKLGESPHDETLDLAELAAHTTVAGLILNLDETVTKE